MKIMSSAFICTNICCLVRSTAICNYEVKLVKQTYAITFYYTVLYEFLQLLQNLFWRDEGQQDIGISSCMRQVDCEHTQTTLSNAFFRSLKQFFASVWQYLQNVFRMHHILLLIIYEPEKVFHSPVCHLVKNTFIIFPTGFLLKQLIYVCSTFVNSSLFLFLWKLFVNIFILQCIWY